MNHAMTSADVLRAEYERIAECLAESYDLYPVVLDQDRAGYCLQILTPNSRWWIGDLAEDWGGSGWAMPCENYLDLDPDRSFTTGLDTSVRDPLLVAHAIAVALSCYTPPVSPSPRQKLEDLRLAVETDPAVIKGYRDTGLRHVEVFRVEDPHGSYLTTVLFDADSEVWTVEPDEIWAAECPTLMEALELFCGR